MRGSTVMCFMGVAMYTLACNTSRSISPVILWEKRGLPETNCNKRYFYRILIRIFL